ncbi:MAG: DUF167 domain-containing protein [Candidatus Omnitrophica bacterium]|nr:DUF167 domain-containing protein [Candidatus Omnitrophota bacterium]
MLLNIRVVPKSSRKLVKVEGERIKVYLTRPAQDGLANEQLIELLSEHFKVKKYQIEIIKGKKTKDKTIKIDEGKDKR